MLVLILGYALHLLTEKKKTTGTLIIYLTIAREYMAAHLVLKFSTYPMGLISVHHGTVSPQYST